MAPVVPGPWGWTRPRSPCGPGALQYIVRAVPATDPPPRKLAIQTLIAEPLVCARVRVLEPDVFLGTIPGVRTVAATDPHKLGNALPDESRIFIRQRNILLDGPQLEGPGRADPRLGIPHRVRVRRRPPTTSPRSPRTAS